MGIRIFFVKRRKMQKIGENEEKSFFLYIFDEFRMIFALDFAINI